MTQIQSSMLPHPQWRMLNVLWRTGTGMKPVNFYEPDLAAIVDADLVLFLLGGQQATVPRRGDTFHLGPFGGEWPGEMRVVLTGRGQRWLRENVYQRAVVALCGLRARPARAVSLITGMRVAGLSGQRDVYPPLAAQGLIRGFGPAGREAEPTELGVMDPSVMQVSLTRAGLYVAASDIDR